MTTSLPLLLQPVRCKVMHKIPDKTSTTYYLLALLPFSQYKQNINLNPNGAAVGHEEYGIGDMKCGFSFPPLSSGIVHSSFLTSSSVVDACQTRYRTPSPPHYFAPHLQCLSSSMTLFSLIFSYQIPPSPLLGHSVAAAACGGCRCVPSAVSFDCSICCCVW